MIKIYRTDCLSYWGHEEYSQKEYIKKIINLVDDAIDFKLNTIYVHRDRLYDLFRSYDDAYQSVINIHNNYVAGRVVEYELSESSIINLVINGELNINHNQIWYFSWNKEKEIFEEFKMKAFI